MKYEQYTLHNTRRSKKTYFKKGRIETETITISIETTFKKKSIHFENWC